VQTPYTCITLKCKHTDGASTATYPHPLLCKRAQGSSLPIHTSRRTLRSPNEHEGFRRPTHALCSPNERRVSVSLATASSALPTSVRALIDPTRPAATLRFSNEREGPSSTFPHTLHSVNEREGPRPPAHIYHHPFTLQTSASVFVNPPAAPSTSAIQ
jgi:hypothetical protein